jgi:prepilin-type N-terminal cleavage/methylation domain-containing protein
MRTISREDGFTLIEMMMSTAITLVVLATAMTTFQNAMALNENATLVADSNQNLRAGTNLLVRDLMQAGRGIPTGGIPIPTGAGSAPINRPSPPNSAYQFDNVTANTLTAITTGAELGPTTSGGDTDMVTILIEDPTSYVTCDPDEPARKLELNMGDPPDCIDDAPVLDADGSRIDVGQFTEWITDQVNGVKPGDLILFRNPASGGTAIQTVTRVSGTEVFFDGDDENDWFNFNQRGAAEGSVMSLASDGAFPQTQVVRIHMVTYYVDATTTVGSPRLVRQLNNFAPQALAGVVEDLHLSFDLVDGVNNPINIHELPYEDLEGNEYSANQIRKVNIHVGVRSDTRSTSHSDYLRLHLSTVVSLRNLAYVDRYNTDQ